MTTTGRHYGVFCNAFTTSMYSLVGMSSLKSDNIQGVRPYTMKNEFINFIDEFPSGDDIPQMLGFHKNASFSKNHKEASKWCNSVLKTISSGIQWNEVRFRVDFEDIRLIEF